MREFVLMTDTQVLLLLLWQLLHSRLFLVLLLIYFVAAPTPCSLVLATGIYDWEKSNGGHAMATEKMQNWEMENRASVAVCQLAHVVLVLRCCNLESFLLTMLPPSCPPPPLKNLGQVF